MALYLYLSLLVLSKLVVSVDLRGTIGWNEICSGYRELGPARVLLDNGQSSNANLRRDGHFLIPQVSPGYHVLSVQAHNHVFDKVLVQVSTDGQNVSSVLPHIPGTIGSIDFPQLSYPIKLSAISRNQYFVPHEAFSILTMFGNPMMLMMGVGAVLIFAMPYLAKQIDPEVLREIQTESSSVRTPNVLNNANMESSNIDKESNYSTSVNKAHLVGRRQTTNTASSPSRNRNSKTRRK